MPLRMVREDLTRLQADALVNATDPAYSGSGGVDAALHRAAGPGLDRACARLDPCPPGEVRLTRGYALPCRYVIHTVGPRWQGGGQGEEALLRACYRRSLELARAKGCRSVAFPLIAADAFGYPKALALRTAIDEISRFLLENEMEVTLAVFGDDTTALGRKLFGDVAEFIDQHYVDRHRLTRSQMFREDTVGNAIRRPMAPPPVGAPAPAAAAVPSLESMLRQLDESFSQMLLRKIDERGMTDAQCYKKANIDRKLFSKIRKDVHYRPSKSTALAFAVALELDLEETRELLGKAGFALSRSSIFDVILEYFIRCGNYNIYEINEALFLYDQSLLGG